MLNMKRPILLWLLLFLLLFLGLGGVYGGIAMLADPSGKSLEMDSVLPLLSVPDYTLPGLFLLFIMGMLPILLIYALLKLPNWQWIAKLSRWSGHYWAWTATLGLAVILIIWLFVQALMIGFKWPIQYIVAINGLLIIVLLLSPHIRKLYAR
jgi:hypothetical protein